jgi:hypothetical protein
VQKHTPPHLLFMKLLYWYVKVFNAKYSHRITSTSFKDSWKFYKFRRTKDSVTNLEKKNKYLKNRVTYFWNVQEKQKIWNKLQNYLMTNKVIHKQWKTWRFQFKKRFWSNSNYYWLALQQWHNDVKWSGHKHILKPIVTNTSRASELMTRQKIGPKWRLRFKSHVNSYSYKYVPRNEYLRDQEEAKTKGWIKEIVNTTTYTRPSFRWHQRLKGALKGGKIYGRRHKFIKNYLQNLQKKKNLQMKKILKKKQNLTKKQSLKLKPSRKEKRKAYMASRFLWRKP